METKELKIQIPEGYEIDKGNSTFECIKFRPIKKYITYEDVSNTLFKDDTGYFINQYGEVKFNNIGPNRFDANTAPNGRQLKSLLALNQLLNISEYYNQIHTKEDYKQYYIVYHMTIGYKVYCYDEGAIPSIVATFNKIEDAQAVIDNPNFREILDTIYKY